MSAKTGRWLLTVCVGIALYLGASQIGFALAYVDGSVSTIWVPTGLALAMVLLGGRRLWPVILIGEFLANLIHGSNPGTSLFMAVGDVLEAFAGQALLQMVGFRRQIDRVRDVFALMTVAALVATLIGGSFGTASLLLFSGLHWSGTWSTWYTWWLGDATGVIIVVPLVLAFTAERPCWPGRRRLFEAVGFVAVLAPVVLLNFGAPPEIGFLTLPALVWGTLRFRQRGATVANAVVAAALVIFVEHSSTVLHGVGLADRLLLVQDFFAVSAMTTLVLAVSTAERERSARALRSSEQAATRLAEEMAAHSTIATAAAEDMPTEELLPLTAKTAAESLKIPQLMIVRDMGVQHALVVAGWASASEAYPPATEVPTDGISVPVRVHGVEWGQLLVPAGEQAVTPEEREHLTASLTRFASQLGQGIASSEAHESLLRRASTDPLTGLVNHRTFHERLHEETTRAARHERPLSVAMLDIDGFKTINDAVGHVAGDNVLATVANRILDVMREEATVARLGGDEIGIILPECDAVSACAVIERARRVVSGTPIGPAGLVRLSGGVCDNTESDEPERLRELADAALYWAKAHGRDRLVNYSPEVIAEITDDERAARVERSQAATGVRALARAIDAKDPATAQHSEHVARLACVLARERGWPDERVAMLREAALVHDVGKLAISDEVLSHAGQLTSNEFEQMQRHPEVGAQIASEMLDTEQVQWIRWHHERPDGDGYPDGLRGPQIPEGAKLLALADSWDTMVNGRAYSEPKTVEEAVDECVELAGSQFAPEAVAALISAHETGLLEAGALHAAPHAYR